MQNKLDVTKLWNKWVPQNVKEAHKQARVQWCKEILTTRSELKPSTEVGYVINIEFYE